MKRRNLFFAGMAAACFQPRSALAEEQLSSGNRVSTCFSAIRLGSTSNSLSVGSAGSSSSDFTMEEVFGAPFASHFGTAALRLARIFGFASSKEVPEIRFRPALSYTAEVEWDAVNMRVPRIVFSRGFVDTELNSGDSGGLALYGYLAHEMAHAVQIKLGLLESSPLDILFLELQADYLAGWALARDESYRYREADIDVFAERLFVGGDLEVHAPDHHGLPPERYTMMMRGFLTARASSPDLPTAMEGATSAYRTFVPRTGLVKAVCAPR